MRPHELQHTRPPCPSPTPGVHSDSCPSSQWCHSAISSFVVPFSSCPQSLPASEFFQWVNSSHEVAKVLKSLFLFCFSYCSSQYKSRTQYQSVCVQTFSFIKLFATLWIIVHQVLLSMEFSWQEYWNGLSFPSPGDLPDPVIEPSLLMSPALAGGFFCTKVQFSKNRSLESYDNSVS